MKFVVKKDFGRFAWSDEILDHIATVPNGVYEIEITRRRQQRSLAQNRYWWGVVVPMVAEEIGNVFEGINHQDAKIGMEETHEALVNRFLPKVKKKNPLDRRRWIVFQTRTSDLDTLQFKQLVDEVLRVFPFIPPPDTGDAMKYYDLMIQRYG